jgi:hypothetical protein
MTTYRYRAFGMRRRNASHIMPRYRVVPALSSLGHHCRVTIFAHFLPRQWDDTPSGRWSPSLAMVTALGSRDRRFLMISD